MNDSTLNQLNESDLDYSSEMNQGDETRCVVDDQFVPKVGMILKTLEEVGKFYKNYSKLVDVRNYITREVWNVSEQDDAKEFGKYLLRIKEKNQNFFFELNLEGDHSIKTAFWADARSRAACEYFGDVVSFDTTYNTNSVHLRKYNLVFGSFVGVDHHGQSTLLGRPDEKRGHPIIQMAIRVLALLHGREGTTRHSHRPMCIDVKSHRDMHANNNWPVVHLAHHEEDPKQTKWLQATQRNRTKD
ncbi:hypothetical protein Ahy_B01g052523 [Arachis hypogaea]|uniref:Uncharacterized protein n=1 Tax=Arachis hypogaea TaxID=3818 RepID=A0A445APP0_ARAHY|nr:hypothetical protein Ahy_B01g052523 [Arachis hypogaea]